MQHDGDSSIEEILESIKKVIARDNRESAMVERKLRETRGLVERAQEPEPKAEPETVEEDDDILDLGSAAAGILDAEPEDDLAMSSADQASLTGATAKESMRQSFAALSMLAGPSAKPRGPSQTESSLEGMVREMLRPMLAEWLDDHLPDIVERLVRAEIDLIAGKKP